MMSCKHKSICILGIILFTVESCISGLDPIPSEIKDPSVSLSIPVGKLDVYRIYTTPGEPYSRPNIPDWAMFDALYFGDTLALDLSSVYGRSSSMDYLALKINIWNDFPIESTAIIYFTDADFNPLYTVDTVTIPKGSILLNGDVVNPGYVSSKIVFDQSQIETFRSAKHIVFEVKLKIGDGNTNDFRFYDKFKLTCYIGARVNFTLNSL
jgi:hypothetical protein